jgi:di/tricarboxylate transporter
MAGQVIEAFDAKSLCSLYALPWCRLLLTLLLTEVLSNHATAVMMLPLVLPLSEALDVASRPFAIAVIMASSLAFALPMGYQTHLTIFGPGGFRFSDFLRVGLPMNSIGWTAACLVIPPIWPFA